MWTRRSDHADLPPSRWYGWSGVVLIATTYVYFLIFAQFGFLKRLDELGITGSHLKLVLVAMATGGVVSSLIAARIQPRTNAFFRLRCALGACAATALLTTLRLHVLSGAAVSLCLGLSLGLLTVTLVTNLDLWTGNSNPLLKVGLGTGLGYFLCNVPVLFNASPRDIALAAAVVCLLAIGCARSSAPTAALIEADQQAGAQPHFGLVLAKFTALIWLDSAAFFIIQSSPVLKSGTWEGASHLWRTGVLHLAGALLAVWLIRRRGLSDTLLCAFLTLGGACLVLLHPESASIAALLYPVGVSVYSVALVAAPAFLLHTSSRADRARKTGWIYALAGWVGSALGIGMGQNLHRVPPSFVAAAGVLFVLPAMWGLLKDYFPQVSAVLVSLAAALALQHFLVEVSPATGKMKAHTSMETGRGVYIAEGCIHCHSQYVRPNSTDTLMWGPTQSVDVIRRQKPPLIGNRRQGPDLSEVGSRRSSLWLRIHFMNPRDVSYDSIMPQYSYLFDDGRGDALLEYVESLRSPQSAEHLRHVLTEWKPAPSGDAPIDLKLGEHLFGHYCATCHLPSGRARMKWASSFKRLPPDLGSDKLLYVPASDIGLDVRRAKIEQIIKFGLPGKDMPGHEYLPDADVLAIAGFVSALQK